MSSTRTYNNDRRRLQADATRQTVIQVAGAQFTAHGYAATSVRQIADAAEVSIETVYKQVGTKKDLLWAWLDASVAGADEPDVAQVDQQWARDLASEPDFARQARLAASNLREVYERSLDVLDVIRSAAEVDDDAAELLRKERSDRHRDVSDHVRHIDPSSLDPDLAIHDVADITYAITDSSVYSILVRERGWSPHHYEQWLADALGRLLGPSNKESDHDQPRTTDRDESADRDQAS
jgi:AcrR family transcriptional regulator